MAFLKRTVTAMTAMAAGLLALLWPVLAQAQAASEYDVKAAFLYNFTKFVEWPPSSFPSDGSMWLCVLGEDPFSKSLDLIASEGVGGRKLQVLRTPKLAEPGVCHVLFISRSERSRMPEILREVRTSPVLTVADTDGFLDSGGIINFKLEGAKVRFEINQEAAERAGIKISSKLLRLATHVKGSPGP